MKFTLNRDPENKTQKIPYPAMQLSGLADAKELVLHAEEGFLLLSRKELTAREAVKAIAFLDGLVSSLVAQLGEASCDLAARWEEAAPLDEFDEEVLEMLQDLAIDLDGLRMLLAVEGGRHLSTPTPRKRPENGGNCLCGGPAITPTWPAGTPLRRLSGSTSTAPIWRTIAWMMC